MKRILIIEDDPAILMGLETLLSQNEFEVSSSQDGQEGFELASKMKPDLLLLDVMLPSMNGFDICSSLKQQGYNFPIFMLTSLTSQGNRLSGLKFGADDYIAKPFNLQELLFKVQNVLKRTDNIRSEIYELEKDYEKAREIQLKTIPQTQPSITGLDVFGKTISALHVGGDYFDYSIQGDTKFIFIIADICGKGLAAAMRVQQIQGIFRSSSAITNSAKDILFNFQKFAGSYLEPNCFITASCAVFDLSKRKVELARAGHLPAILKRGEALVEIKPSGIMIGKHSDSIFWDNLKLDTIDLLYDDIFVFYTDGVIEAENNIEEEFGVDRLKNSIINIHGPSSKIVEEILLDVQKFSNRANQLDDITLAVIQVQDQTRREVL